MDSIMEALARWADRMQDAGRNKVMVALLLGAGAALIAASYLVWPLGQFGESAMVMLAGTAGVAWTAAAFMLWYQFLPLDLAQRVWVRSYMELKSRRKFALIIGGVWLILIAVIGKGVLQPVVGALDVVVLTALWRTGTTTAEEREALTAAMEAEEALRAEQAETLNTQAQNQDAYDDSSADSLDK